MYTRTSHSKEGQVDGDSNQSVEAVFDMIHSENFCYRNNNNNNNNNNEHQSSTATTQVNPQVYASLISKYNFHKVELEYDVKLLLVAYDVLTTQNTSICQIFQQQYLVFRITSFEIISTLQHVLFYNINTYKVKTNTEGANNPSMTATTELEFSRTASLEVNFLKLMKLISNSTSITTSQSVLQKFCEQLLIDDKLKQRLLPFINILGHQINISTSTTATATTPTTTVSGTLLHSINTIEAIEMVSIV